MCAQAGLFIALIACCGWQRLAENDESYMASSGSVLPTAGAPSGPTDTVAGAGPQLFLFLFFFLFRNITQSVAPWCTQPPLGRWCTHPRTKRSRAGAPSDDKALSMCVCARRRREPLSRPQLLLSTRGIKSTNNNKDRIISTRLTVGQGTRGSKPNTPSLFSDDLAASLFITPVITPRNHTLHHTSLITRCITPCFTPCTAHTQPSSRPSSSLLRTMPSVDTLRPTMLILDDLPASCKDILASAGIQLEFLDEIGRASCRERVL